MSPYRLSTMATVLIAVAGVGLAATEYGLAGPPKSTQAVSAVGEPVAVKPTTASHSMISDPDASKSSRVAPQLETSLLSPVVVDPTANSASYQIFWQSINSGGTMNGVSPSYQMKSSVGQSVTGEASSSNYTMQMGFWYGAGTGEGGCGCPCEYDPECDGVISDVLDVTRTINVAFRGQPSTQDSGCPVERSDVDASGATDVIDVTKVINVAFRGQPAASNYVDPCL